MCVTVDNKFLVGCKFETLHDFYKHDKHQLVCHIDFVNVNCIGIDTVKEIVLGK